MNKLPSFRLSPGDLFRPENAALQVFADLPVLETPRLRLRKMRMRDAKDLYAWMSDAEVAKYVLWDAHKSLSETRSYLRYIRGLYRRGMPSSWGLELRETGKVIGTIGVMSWFPDHRCAEVGYSLGRAWWHQGYAAEALEAVMDLLFDRAMLTRVEAQCDVRNPDSARVMEKCGMKREGILRQRIWNKGEAVDVMLYAALKSERRKESSGNGPGAAV